MFENFETLLTEGSRLDGDSPKRKAKLAAAGDIYSIWFMVLTWHHCGELHARVNSIQTTCRYIFKNFNVEHLCKLYTIPAEFNFSTDTLIWMGIHVPFETLKWMYRFDHGALWHQIIVRGAIRAGRTEVAEFFILKACESDLKYYLEDAQEVGCENLAALIEDKLATYEA